MACYLQVIHMDLKSRNILLNKDHTLAKIADVGLSRGMSVLSPGTFLFTCTGPSAPVAVLCSKLQLDLVINGANNRMLG